MASHVYWKHWEMSQQHWCCGCSFQLISRHTGSLAYRQSSVLALRRARGRALPGNQDTGSETQPPMSSVIAGKGLHFSELLGPLLWTKGLGRHVFSHPLQLDNTTFYLFIPLTAFQVLLLGVNMTAQMCVPSHTHRHTQIHNMHPLLPRILHPESSLRTQKPNAPANSHFTHHL